MICGALVHHTIYTGIMTLHFGEHYRAFLSLLIPRLLECLSCRLILSSFCVCIATHPRQTYTNLLKRFTFSPLVVSFAWLGTVVRRRPHTERIHITARETAHSFFYFPVNRDSLCILCLFPSFISHNRGCLCRPASVHYGTENC